MAAGSLYINGTTEKYFKNTDTIPEGYVKAKVFYINNGEINKRWYNKETIPSGFVLGKLPISRNWTESQHKHHSEETKEKIRLSKVGKYSGSLNPFYGKNHTEATKNKISEKSKGRAAYNKDKKLSEEEKVERNKKLIEKYGSLDAFYTESIKKAKQTKLEKYGNENYNNREKAAETTFSHFGVNYYCMTDEFRKGHGNTSKYNDKFKILMQTYNLYINDKESKEFPLQNYLYDFKYKNTLIEIDPTITHNSYQGIYNTPPKTDIYHQEKTLCANKNNYECIHIFDWDDAEKVLLRFIEKEIIYARKCIIREVSKIETKEFLKKYHLQGTCTKQDIRLGLYYNEELLQVMTFGKPRYNKKYEYELLRLCTKAGYLVIGGAERLFKYFINNYTPVSIISYCDNAKFNGDVYKKLGFILLSYGKPSKHWYNLETSQHITDNLLRQRGFDQLFGTSYGKGTSNEELMLESNFLPVYDCGQSTFVWSNT